MEYKNKLMIRKGNKSQEPYVVYVSHKNRFNLWVCEVVNTGDTVFSKSNQLIEFNYIAFKKMYYQWKITETSRSKNRFKELLAELQ